MLKQQSLFKHVRQFKVANKSEFPQIMLHTLTISALDENRIDLICRRFSFFFSSNHCLIVEINFHCFSLPLNIYFLKYFVLPPLFYLVHWPRKGQGQAKDRPKTRTGRLSTG